MLLAFARLLKLGWFFFFQARRISAGPTL